MTTSPSNGGDRPSGVTTAVAALLTSLTALTLPLAGFSVVPVDVAAADGSPEVALLAKLAALRAAEGAPALAVDEALNAVARRWSARMAGDGTMAHNTSLASDVPPGWTRIGENVGSAGNVDQVFEAWLQSASHRTNMVDAGFNRVGAGVAGAGDGLYVTLDFTTMPAAPPPATKPAPTPAPTPAAAEPAAAPAQPAPPPRPEAAPTPPAATPAPPVPPRAAAPAAPGPAPPAAASDAVGQPGDPQTSPTTAPRRSVSGVLEQLRALDPERPAVLAAVEARRGDGVVRRPLGTNITYLSAALRTAGNRDVADVLGWVAGGVRLVRRSVAPAPEPAGGLGPAKRPSRLAPCAATSRPCGVWSPRPRPTR